MPNSHIRLDRNPTFHDAANVQIDTVIYYPSSDLAAAVRRFQAGELHLTTDVPADQIKSAARSASATRSGSRPISAPISSSSTRRRPPFDDVRVRQALSHA